MQFHRIYIHSFDGIIRYIGVTKGSERDRLLQHLKSARRGVRSHHCNWLRSLGESPAIDVIEWVRPEDRAEREKYWIALARDYGHVLVNGTDGGDGLNNPTLEARANMSAAHTGLVRSLESIEKQRATMTGRPRTAEHCKNISEGKKGIPPTPKVIAASIAAHTGRKQSAETIAKRTAKTRGLKRTPEQIERSAAPRRGRKRTPEQCARMKEAQRKWRAEARGDV